MPAGGRLAGRGIVRGVENVEIAKALEEMADLLEIQGANPFRVRAYRNAARTVEENATPFRKLIAEEADLTELPGIGKEMASHIRQLVASGKLSVLEELAREVPRSLIDLMRLPGVGPKKAAKLWKELGITTLDELERAARAARIKDVEGFGEKSQQKILAALERLRARQARFKLSDADQLAAALLGHLRDAPGLERLAVAGSYRRRRETVRDLDLLAIAAQPAAVVERFTGYREVARVDMAGDTRATVVLRSGLQVDLRILPRKSYGAALVYFTGSKAHNIKLRRIAVERGLRISEYGVFREAAGVKAEREEEAARDPWAGKWVAGREEKDVYKAVGLPWIPPELREDRGEIEAAQAGELPELIEPGDIRGDLQMHSTWSDGKNSIGEMLAACEAKGYEYMALTDHSKVLAMTGGLDAARLREQWKEIEEVAVRHPGIRLLRSMEIDILADGSLDLEDEMIERLDLVVVSVHSRFDLPAAQQTRRILKALEHPRVHLLAHPTGRLINRREAMEFDLDEVLHCAGERGVAIECNAQPDRLDLKDTHLLLARKLGLKVAVNTDAHRTGELDLMRYGVEQARRAWLGKGDVLNALPLRKLVAHLSKR